MIAIIRRTAPLFLLLTSTSFGYIRLTTCTDTVPPATGTCSPIPIQRVDNTGIQFVMDTGIVAGATSNASGSAVTVISANSNPQAAARAALTTWNNVTTANVTFLPLQSKATVAALDGIMSIVIATAAEETSYVGSALAVTVTSSATSAGQDPFNSALTLSDGSIVDTDILLNPGVTFSTDGSTTVDLQAVLTHEFGHSLGADHTGVLGATMFQYNHLNQRFLSTDDLTFVNSVYPATSNSQPFGTISGTVTAAGAIPAPYAMLAFVDNTRETPAMELISGDSQIRTVPIPFRRLRETTLCTPSRSTGW